MTSCTLLALEDQFSRLQSGYRQCGIQNDANKIQTIILSQGTLRKEDRRGIACMPVGRASSCAVKPRVRALIIVSTLGKKFRQYNHGFMITEGI